MTGGMESMYMDMNGGAGVIGAMCAIAGRKLPVTLCLTEACLSLLLTLLPLHPPDSRTAADLR